MTSTPPKRLFHFTIGPVQGFVAQARRTRDFWAGSFLLSWLSGVAMREVMEQENGNPDVIRFPEPDPAFIAAIVGKASQLPQQGTIPNRFMAQVNAESFKPERVPEAVLAAWRALANQICEGDKLDNSAGKNTMEIWKCQVEGFWEMTWAFSEKDSETDVLDRRKNLRSHLPPEQAGVKCMLMDGWQELSGATDPGDPILRQFWSDRRKQGTKGLQTDLRPGEHLCALAYIKRRFPRWFKGVSVRAGETNWTIHGWEVPASLPSVSYMAATHWIEAAIENAAQDATVKNKLWDFHDAARDLLHDRYPEATTNLRCIRAALDRHDLAATWKWRALDGDVFFEHALRNHREFPDSEDPNRLDPLAVGTLKALNELRKAAVLSQPTPFYALLMMDGDNLGMHMSNLQHQPNITQALAKFTGQVKNLVEQHNGYLIFAGGDDVLALMTLEDALPAAAALQRLYADCFADTGVPSTLSGAIEYAHVKMPLTRVIADAHQLLDDVAKERRGRNAIACRVWKPGGKALEWAMPWEKALDNEGKVIIAQLAAELRQSEQATPFANRFFYRIRERLQAFAPHSGEPSIMDKEDKEDKEQASALIIALMTAEYLGSGINQNRGGAQKVTYHQAKDQVTKLLDQCHYWSRQDGKLIAENDWPADGALLLRFLIQKGVEQ